MSFQESSNKSQCSISQALIIDSRRNDTGWSHFANKALTSAVFSLPSHNLFKQTSALILSL